jgi:hypothetical protein
MSMTGDANSPPPFLLGANLPWIRYGLDFGANAWQPGGGVSNSEARVELERAFARLSASGVRWVRWFLLCDGRAGIDFNADGHPTSIDHCVFKDMDTALEVAARHQVRVMFVLVDFLWCDEARLVNHVQIGGRAHVLQNAAHRAALLENVFQPILERYDDEPQIFAWDVMNEPEWIRMVEPGEIGAFLRDAVSLIHSTTSHAATVGSAGIRWRSMYKDLGLDFYQVHWYDSLKRQPALATPVAELGFDRPVLLGEFPTRGSKHTAAEIVDAVRRAGYSGAFYWSLLSNDKYSG